MSGVRLKLKAPPRQRVDLSALTPERLAGMRIRDIAAIPLHLGNRQERLDSLFEIAALKGNDDLLEIEDSCDRLDGIGRGMTAGRIVVRGDAGAHVAARLAGGTVEVKGSVGPCAGAAMRSGMLKIAGDAGDFLAASLAGERKGMLGGVVAVSGSAGIRAGDRMRRGTVLIGGDAGACCGARMIAGTVAVLGRAGAFPGFGMKRGSLILFREPERLLPTFAGAGTHDFAFLGLMGRSWGELGGAFAEAGARLRRADRFVGDAAAGGKGEILVCRT